MKKVVCVMLAVLMCLNGFAVALAEYEFTNIEGDFVSVFDFSAEEWMKSDMNRALLTIGLALDVEGQEGIPHEVDFSVGSYVGRSGMDLTVIIGTEDDSVVLGIMYNPYLNIVSYMYMEDIDSFDAFCIYMMMDLCPDGYYKNDFADVVEVIGLLSEIMNK